MFARRSWKISLAVMLAGSLLGAGSASLVSSSAGAAIHKKHPKHHSKKKPSAAATLKEYASQIEAAKHATYQAVFTAAFAGQTETITVAQAPPKALFETSSGSVIQTGTETLFCQPTSNTCVKESVGATNPLASMFTLFSPTAVHTAFAQAEARIAARAAGYSVKFSSATYGGLASKCVTLGVHGVSAQYCVSKAGLLTRASTKAGSFTLKSFTTNVPSSDFTAPAGATIVTIPGYTGSGATG